MVLVDTSVWIRFLANQAPYAAQLDELLSVDEVVGHELVYGELLIGDQGGRRDLLASYAQIQQVAIVPHLEVVEFTVDRRLHGQGVGWVDIHLLASALVGHVRLWTADRHLATLAVDFGIAYAAPAARS